MHQHKQKFTQLQLDGDRMTRARILADYVSSGDELALKAPLASPAFTGSPSITLGSDATGDVYYRAADGALTRLATGADGTVLTSTGVGAVPAFEAVAGGANTPSFLVHTYDMSEYFTVSTFNLVNFTTVAFDTGSYWDSSSDNWKFLPTDGVSKKYYIYSMLKFQDGGGFRVEGLIYKNGTAVARSRTDEWTKYSTFWQATTVTLNGSTDYVQMYCWYGATAGGSTPGDNKYLTNDPLSTYFGGYALIN